MNNRSVKKTTAEFIKEIETNHPESYAYYDWSETVYTGARGKTTVICPVHGTIDIRCYSLLQGAGCKLCKLSKSMKSRHQSGLGHTVTLQEFKERGCKKYNNWYDYGKVEFNTTADNIIIICPEHGEFSQLASGHLYGYGCNQCGNDINRKSTELYIEQVKKDQPEIYNQIDWTDFKYVNNTESAIYKCKIHGDISRNPINVLMGYGCSYCKNDTKFTLRSTTEINMYNVINRCGIETKTNDRFILGGNEVDIVMVKEKIMIEVDGVYFHTTRTGRHSTYHLNKTLKANEVGYDMYHFWDFEVSNAAKSKVLPCKQIVNANECDIHVIDVKTAIDFQHVNQVEKAKQEFDIALGLFNKDNLIQIALFKDGDEYNELVSFATYCFVNVIDGTVKLIDHFTNNYSDKAIVCELDRRLYTGRELNDSGFVIVGYTDPDYFYYNNNILTQSEIDDIGVLGTVGDTYDPSKDEESNLNSIGYYRAYDCGKIILNKAVQ